MPQPVGCIWIYINVSRPPFDNKKVRQAIAYAFDKNELVKAAYWGLGEPINNQPFLNRSRMYVPVTDRQVNLVKAKELLAEAGYPRGFTIEIATGMITTMVDGCNVLVGQLREIGIKATVRSTDPATLFPMLTRGDYSISFFEDSERLDPDDAYYMRFHSGEIGKNNWSRYSNPEMDRLLEQGRATWKWEDRIEIYKKVVELNKEDLAILYAAKSVIPIAYRDYVKGHGAGMATWFGYHRGGMKKVWMDK